MPTYLSTITITTTLSSQSSSPFSLPLLLMCFLKNVLQNVIPTSPLSCIHLKSVFHCFKPSFNVSLPHLSLHPVLPFYSSLIFHPVTSEMDWKTGISSTISVSSRPPQPEPPDPSVPFSLRTRPPSITQQARPTPYAYTLPAFTRAHPPALPKIFQPGAGSGIGQQIFLILCGLLSL